MNEPDDDRNIANFITLRANKTIEEIIEHNLISDDPNINQAVASAIDAAITNALNERYKSAPAPEAPGQHKDLDS